MKAIFNLGLAVMVLALFTCGDNGMGPEDQEIDGNVSLSMGTPATLSNLNRVTSSAQAITISRVRLLLEEVKLKAINEDSADFKIGPLVVDLNLVGSLTEIGVGSIPMGTYKKFEFKVKKVDEDDVDQSDPQFADFIGTEKSIIIEGIYNGEDFTLSIEEDFHQETELIPPVEIVSDTSTTNLTLLVNVDNWFVGSEPMDVLDPMDPNNSDQIEENIEASFEAFEDDDGDGELDFEGEVSIVNLDNDSFTLTNSLIVVTDSTTIFEGSIQSVETVSNLLSQGNTVSAEGEGYRLPDGSVFATEVEFEVED